MVLNSYFWWISNNKNLEIRKFEEALILLNPLCTTPLHQGTQVWGFLFWPIVKVRKLIGSFKHKWARIMKVGLLSERISGYQLLNNSYIHFLKFWYRNCSNSYVSWERKWGKYILKFHHLSKENFSHKGETFIIKSHKKM